MLETGELFVMVGLYIPQYRLTQFKGQIMCSKVDHLSLVLEWYSDTSNWLRYCGYLCLRIDSVEVSLLPGCGVTSPKKSPQAVVQVILGCCS